MPIEAPTSIMLLAYHRPSVCQAQKKETRQVKEQVDDDQDGARQDQHQATPGPGQATTQAASVNPDERMDDPKISRDDPRAKGLRHRLYPGRAKPAWTPAGDDIVGQYSLNISRTIIERLRLAGARVGIFSTSRLIEIAVLGYLQHCAVVTRMGLDAKLGRYTPGQPLAQSGQSPTGAGQTPPPPDQTRAEPT